MSIFKRDKNAKKLVHFYPITIKRILECFYSSNKYEYLGITWTLFRVGTQPNKDMQDFIKFVDSQAKPKWCPRWLLNLLHLFGNDNSIVRCRNSKISDLRNKLCKGIMIRDIKEKWGTLRVYGSFTEEIEKELRILEEKINPYLEAY